MHFLKRRLIDRASELVGTPLSFHKDITVEQLQAYIDRIESKKKRAAAKRQKAY